MLTISVTYIVIAFCIFRTLLLFRSAAELGRTQNWELLVLMVIAFFWLVALVVIFATFVLAGPVLSILRYLRRVRVA